MAHHNPIQNPAHNPADRQKIKNYIIKEFDLMHLLDRLELANVAQRMKNNANHTDHFDILDRQIDFLTDTYIHYTKENCTHKKILKIIAYSFDVWSQHNTDIQNVCVESWYKFYNKCREIITIA